MARRGRSLTFKVDLILVVALAAGVGAVMTAFAASLFRSRDQLTAQSLNRQGDDHFYAVETLMLSGDGPQALGYFTKVNETDSSVAITLYRRDGRLAFSDNSTIETVNRNQQRMRFELQDRPARAAAPDPPPRFAEAAGIPPQDLIFRDDDGLALFGGTAYYRAYRPLINLPKCTVCHGSDHTVRGVIDMRSDVTTVVRAQGATIAGAGAGFLAVVAAMTLVIGSFLRQVVLRPVQAIGRVCADVTAGRFEGRVEVRSEDEIGRLARTVNTMVQGLHERFQLTKYVSAGTIGALRESEEPRRVPRTLFFSDVRGFTSYTESRPAEHVVGVLNRLLEMQSEVIQQHGGDIDKFVGDEVVAVFSGPDASRRACEAALDVIRRCAASSRVLDGLAVGVGIDSGSVIHGMIGSARRADFTVIGDSVNVASRLCGVAKGMQIVVSDRVRSEAGELPFRGPYSVRLKGKSGPERVWLLAAAGEGGSV